MARYRDEAEAAADGYTIEHEPDAQRFVLVQSADASAERLGEAHYRLLGGDPPDEHAAIDFDHTYVHPSLRGTGLSGILVRRALTDEITRDRRLDAGCWFVAGYLEKHPELRR